MNKSFKDMTPEEKNKARNKILQMPVTAEEITKFDPMIHRLVKQEVLRYWGNGAHVYTGDAIIGRLGMSFSDLMQYGRLLVCNQIRWFKARGTNPDTGKPWNAKMSTLIHQQLRNKFMSLSKSFSSEKNGGQVVNVSENKKALRKFVDVLFDPNAELDVNLCALRLVVSGCTKDIRDKMERTFSSNGDLIKFVSTLANTETISHVSYDEIEGFSGSVGLSPEEALLLKEEIASRAASGGFRVAGVSTRPHRQPQFLPKNVSTRLMVLAKECGIGSQRELAEQLGIGMTTLSNIIRGRSRGTQTLRNRLESRFGRTFEELMQVVEI